jgi:hypothetical protein
MENNNLSAATVGASSQIPGGELIGSAVDAIASKLMPQSKAAKAAGAVKAIAAGQYWTLRPYLKNMEQIPQYVIDQVKGQNIAYFAILQLPAQGIGANNTDIIKKLQAMTAAGRDAIPGIDPTAQSAKPEALLIVGEQGTAVQAGTQAASSATTSSLSKYLPYIIGAIILSIIIYLIVKNKK